MSYYLFKTEESDIKIKNSKGEEKIIPTKVSYAWDYDNEAPDFDLGSEEANKEEMLLFKSGELLNLSLKVSVNALGEYGYDYLGQCFVEAKQWEKELISLAKMHDMKENASIELKNNILCQFHVLKEALE